LLRLFAAMQQAGYRVEHVPESGDALLHALIDRCSYDAELLTPSQLAQAAGQVHARQYGQWYEQLPAKNQQEMRERWGAAPGSAYVHDGHVALAGLELGNVFVALQPPRGYGMDPNLIYHMPDLPPPHHYQRPLSLAARPGRLGRRRHRPRGQARHAGVAARQEHRPGGDLLSRPVPR